MAFTLVFGAVAALIALLLFNSGMLASAKTRLQNAADAGAYSAALLQARDHNFAAYTNRSMGANQVAVVQLVSLKSYPEDAADTQQRMSELLLDFKASAFPTREPAWDLGKRLPIQSLNSTFVAIAPVTITGLDRLIKAHETAQQAHHAVTILDMALVADEVVTQNDPRAEMTNGDFRLDGINVQTVTWGNTTSRYHANDSSPQAERLLPNHVRSRTTFSFVHAGASQLSEDKKRWLALDATTGSGAWSCTVGRQRQQRHPWHGRTQRADRTGIGRGRQGSKAGIEPWDAVAASGIDVGRINVDVVPDDRLR